MMYPESIQCNYLLKYKPGVFTGKYSLRSFSRFFFSSFKDYSSSVDKKLKRLVLVLKMEMALLFADGSRMFHFLHVWGTKKKFKNNKQ